jgi:hypothetical protein
VLLSLRCVPQDHGPYAVVAVQECGRMNWLLEEVERSLVELRKGLNGQLNMSQAMEDLTQVPHRTHKLKMDIIKYVG